MIDLDDPQQVCQADRLRLQAVAADPHLPEQALHAASAGGSITYSPQISGLAHLATTLNAQLSPDSVFVQADDDLQPDLTFDTHPAYTLAFFLASSAQISKELKIQLTTLDHTWLRSLQPETPIVDNVAKQMALRLYQHIPLIWSGETWLSGVGEDWRLRILYYAESAALAAESEAMQRVWSMARFPHFWPNGVTVLHLAGQVSTGAKPADDALATILAARRIPRLQLAAHGKTRVAAALHYLYLGNWVALYLAALYQVDPADRVPLQLLSLI